MQMPMVYSTSYRLGTTKEQHRTSGSAAKLEASGAEKAIAMSCSFPIRYINKSGFNYLTL
jgi:hypothetical protein